MWQNFLLSKNWTLYLQSKSYSFKKELFFMLSIFKFSPFFFFSLYALYVCLQATSRYKLYSFWSNVPWNVPHEFSKGASNILQWTTFLCLYDWRKRTNNSPFILIESFFVRSWWRIHKYWVLWKRYGPGRRINEAVRLISDVFTSI